MRYRQQLERFKTLQPGWDSYDATPPSPEIIEKAAQFLDFMEDKNYSPHGPKPSVIGGIGITFRHKEKRVYVEFNNRSGEAYVLFMGGKDQRCDRLDQTPVGYTKFYNDLVCFLQDTTNK